MFDDPKKELKRLEDQLLAAEMTDEEFEEFYSEVFEEFGEQKPQQRNMPEYLPADQPQQILRNYANGYGTKNVTGRPQAPDPVQGNNRSAVPQAPAGNTYTDKVRPAPPVKKDKSIQRLVIAAVLLSLGIVAVVLWWVIRLL